MNSTTGLELLKAVKVAHDILYSFNDSFPFFKGTRIGRDSNKIIVYLIFDLNHLHDVNSFIEQQPIQESIDGIFIRLLFE